MKSVAASIVVLVLLCAVASAQWLETTIPIRNASGPRAFCYVPSYDRLYCCCESIDSVAVINPGTNSVIRYVAVGDRPFVMCSDPASSLVYVANLGSNSVSIIDAASDSVIATVAVGTSPYDLRFNPTSNKLYCANYEASSVSVIDGTSHELLTTIPVGSARYLCLNSVANKVYVANRWKAYVIDGRFDLVVDSFATGDRVHSMVLNSALTKLYCSDYEGTALTVADATGDSVLRTVLVGSGPEALCVGQDDEVYCTTWGNGNVVVLDGSADTLEAIVRVGTNPLALLFDPPHNKVYCANYDDSTVSIMDGVTRTIAQTIAVGAGPLTFAQHTATGRVYVANYSSNTISVIRDTADAVTEEPATKAVKYERSATFATHELSCPMPTILSDACGRRVATLPAGRSDISFLKPGVYIARSPDSMATRRLMVVR